MIIASDSQIQLPKNVENATGNVAPDAAMSNRSNCLLHAMAKLKLIVSEKTKRIPECHAATIVQQALRRRGLEVGFADAWVDLGVDAGVGKRVETTLNKRGNAARPRAN